MGFMESYKKLDNLCMDLRNSDKGITSYIQEMEQCRGAGDGIPGWKDDYYRLKHLRYLRNKIAHENGANEQNQCDRNDSKWLESFYRRILHQTDPLALFEKSQKAGLYKKPVHSGRKGSKKNKGSHALLILILIMGILLLAAWIWIIAVWNGQPLFP